RGGGGGRGLGLGLGGESAGGGVVARLAVVVVGLAVVVAVLGRHAHGGERLVEAEDLEGREAHLDGLGEAEDDRVDAARGGTGGGFAGVEVRVGQGLAEKQGGEDRDQSDDGSTLTHGSSIASGGRARGSHARR